MAFSLPFRVEREKLGMGEFVRQNSIELVKRIENTQIIYIYIHIL